MNKQHNEGFWVNQLTEEDVKQLMETLMEKKKNTKFKYVHKQEKKDNKLLVTYVAKRTDVYSSNPECHATLEDFKISGGLSYLDYFQFMIETFGEEYADDLLQHIDNYIEAGNEDVWATTRLPKIKAAVPAMLDSHTHNQHNDL